MSKSNSFENAKAAIFRPKAATLVLLIGLIMLFFSICMSIILGVADINLSTVIQGLFHFDSTSTAHQIVYRLRLPRALAATFIGASLAVSGAIMQGMTRNALASPSIMGVTSGAMFAVSIAFAFLSAVSNMTIMLFAFIGAGLGAALVFLIGALSKRINTNEISARWYCYQCLP